MPDLHDVLSAAAGPMLGWLLRASAEAAVVAAAVWVAQRLLGRWLTPAWRHRLWGLVVLRLVLPVPPASPTSVWNVVPALAALPGASALLDPSADSGDDGRVPSNGSRPVTSTTADKTSRPPRDSQPAATLDAASTDAAAAKAGRGLKVRYGYGPLAPTTGRPADANGGAAGTADAADARDAADANAAGGGDVGRPGLGATGRSAFQPTPADARGWPSTAAAVAAAVWLSGVVLLLLRLVRSNAAFHRRLRSATVVTDTTVLDLLADCAAAVGLRRTPPVVETDAVAGPAAAGVLRPALLVPPGLLATLSPAERRVVLLHELAHVRRRDVAANWAFAVVSAVHWFNPVVWLAFACLRADRELARDAMVLAVAAAATTAGRAGHPGEREREREGDGGPALASFADQYARTLLKLAHRVAATAAIEPAGGRRLLAAATSPGFVGMVGDEAGRRRWCHPDGERPKRDAGRFAVWVAWAAVLRCPWAAWQSVGHRLRRCRASTADRSARHSRGRAEIGPQCGPYEPARIRGHGQQGTAAHGTRRSHSSATGDGIFPGLLGRRSGLERRLTMITETPAMAAKRFALVGPALFLAIGCGTLTGPRAVTEPAGSADRSPTPATAPVRAAATGPATAPAETVAALIRRARQLTADGRFADAIADVDKILAVDPKNEYALGVRPLLEDRVGSLPQRRYVDSVEDRAAAGKLERRLPEINLDGVGFADAVDHLRDVAEGPAFWVNWKAMEAAGVTKSTPVTLRRRNVAVQVALTDLLAKVGRPTAQIGTPPRLGWTIENGVVAISTADELAKDGPPPASRPASRQATGSMPPPNDDILDWPVDGWPDIRRVGPATQPAVEAAAGVVTVVAPATRPGAAATRPAGAPRNAGIEGLQAATRRLVDQENYIDALGVIHEIQRRDPTNRFAAGVRPWVEDRLAAQQRRVATNRQAVEALVADATPPASAGDVGGMVRVAKGLESDGRYADALVVVERVLSIDPGNEYASGVRQLLEDRVAVRRAAGRSGVAEMLAAGDGGLQPATDEQRRAMAEQRTVQQRLDRKLPEVRIENLPFSKAIDELRARSGGNIFVNWKALEMAGVDRNAPINLRLYNIKVSKALDIVLDSVATPKVRLGYTIDEGVISVSTDEDLSKNVLTRVYDIRDLLVDVPDYDPAAATRPATTVMPTTGPATAPATRPTKTEVEAVREALSTQVIHLIQETVGPDSWRETGGKVGAIKHLSGQLVVTQTPENHQSLRRLLDQLREQKNIQALVEARYVSCDEAFMTDLLARMGLPAGPNGGPVPRVGGGNAFEGGPASPVLAGGFLTAEQADQILRAVQTSPDAAVLAAPRLTLFNGQRGYVMVGTSRAYVRDYVAVVGPAGETRYEPRIGDAESGVTLDVQSTASADRKYVTLTLRPKVTTLAGLAQAPWPGGPAGSGLAVQVPDLRTSGLTTTVSVPDGGTVLLGGMADTGIAAPGAVTAGRATGLAGSAAFPTIVPATPATSPAVPETSPAVTPAGAASGPASLAGMRPAAAGNRRLYLLVRSKLILKQEVRTRGPSGPGAEVDPSRTAPLPPATGNLNVPASKIVP